MKRDRYELVPFVAGLVMLASGLFILSQKVYVYTGFFGWGSRFNSGLIIVPLIIGIVWKFLSDTRGATILIIAGVAIIVIYIITSTHLYMRSMTLFDWIITLVLLFGGVGLIGRSFGKF